MTNKFKSFLENKIVKNILLMLGFGVLSILFGELKFSIPGVEGGTSDLREVVVFISVIYLPHWIYLIGVSLITSLSTPAEGIMISTIVMHIVATLFAYAVYTFIKNKIKNNYYLGLSWAGMIILNYAIFLIPSMIGMYVLVGLIEYINILDAYKSVMITVKYEIFTTTAVTALYLTSFSMRETLQRRNKELFKAKAKAEESDKLKTAFLQNISHEIRTPLNGIVGFVNILASEGYSEKNIKRYSDIINNNSEYLLRLIDQVIEFSQLEAEIRELSNEWHDIKELRCEIKEYFNNEKCKLKKEHIILNIDISNDLENCEIYVDKEFLLKILMHLVQNAINFTGKGSVTVGLQKHNKDKLLMYVRDTGFGIPVDEKEKIFNRFYQIDTFQKGVGLGLTFAEKITKILNGEIWVLSDENKGSTFNVTLPVRFNKTESTIHEQNEKEEIEKLIVNEKYILIAEDDNTIYFYLKTILDQIGIKSVHAKNGLEALNLVKGNNEIGLILMDMKMPVLDGLSATKQIKILNPKIPIIVQTAYDLNEDKKLAFEAGCDDFISKPIIKSSLISVLSKYSDIKN